MITLLPEDGYLGIDTGLSYQEANVVIIPFGLESSVSYGSGTQNGPQAIINASHQVELFDDELWCEPYKNIKFCTLSEPEISSNTDDELNRVESITTQVLNDGKMPVVLGGEHSISAGIIRPFVKQYNDLVILHFDAHADLRDSYDGNKNSHACALRRCLDHENVSLVSYGVRNISQEEVHFLEQNHHRIKINWARDKEKWDLNKDLQHFKDKHVYLTFDVDAFDSSIMPATGTPEPGGMLWNDALSIIKNIMKVSNVVGIDINELAPRANMHACDFLVAKLLYKMLSYKFYNADLL